MDFSSISIPLTTILWIIWGCVALAWVIMTGMVWYHWHNYARGDKRVRRMKSIYFVCSALLFASAASFIFSL